MPNTYPVRSLIQGVSEQSSFSRPQSSAESQRNCINDLLFGSRARNGTRVIATHTWDTENAFFHRIERSADEDYQVVVKGTALNIINLADGTIATLTKNISDAAIEAYLTHTGDSSLAFAAATIEDTSLLANRQKTVAMSSSTSSARTNQALMHFKSANYSTTYKLIIKYSATTLTITYKTPDNSAAVNAELIATNKLAEEFADALATALGGSGWGISRAASSILVSHPTHDFTVYSEDGLGGQQLIAFKDRVKKLTDLPTVAWDGYQVAVGNTKSATEADFYLEYSGDAQGGVWEEVVKWSTETDFDEATMPLMLTNTGVNAFTIDYAPWGSRLAGDGVETAKDPSFVGKTIRDLQFFDGRLAIIGEGYWTLSRARNAFVFFPDTVQTNLQTAPVDYIVANGKVSLVTRAVVVGEKLHLWANKLQSVVASGQDALSEETAENPPTTNYEYDGLVPPVPVGQSGLVFATGNRGSAVFTEVVYKNGKAVGEIPLNEHCPSFVKGVPTHLFPAGSIGMMFALTDDDATRIYLYQWSNRGEDRIQSAWNYWDMPGCDGISWVGTSGSEIKMLVRHGTKTSLETMEASYEGDEDGVIPLRADHRLNEVALAPSAPTNGVMTVDLPWSLSDAQKENFVVYERVDDDETGEQRGRILPHTWTSGTQFTIRTENEDIRFFAGHIPVAEREPGTLYVMGRDGTEMTDNVLVQHLAVYHTNSTAYELVIRTEDRPGEEIISRFSARKIGDPAILNSRTVAEKEGVSGWFKVGYDAGKATILLRNREIYPSSWEAMKYIYRAEMRAP
jgi:hypothetical protein